MRGLGPLFPPALHKHALPALWLSQRSAAEGLMSGKQNECKAKQHTFIDSQHLEYLCSPCFTRHERDIVLKLNSEQEPLSE